MCKNKKELKELFDKYIDGYCSFEEFEQILIELTRSGAEFDHADLWKEYFSQVEKLKEKLEPDSSEEASLVLTDAKCREKRHKRLFKNSKLKNYLVLGVACITFLFSISVLTQQYKHQLPSFSDLNKNSFKEKQTEYGERKNITLSDGSNVVLNSGSKLAFPEQFGENRKLFLEGQAFFQVAKNPQRPFVIETNTVTVTVLGTSFDVKNFDDDNYSSITVVTGKVKVEGNGECFYLLPNEQLLFDKQAGRFSKKHVEASKNVLWKGGMLYFEDTPVSDMIRQLERFYNVKINVNNSSILDMLVSGEHSNESLEAVLKSLNFVYDINYSFKNNQIYLYDN